MEFFRTTTTRRKDINLTEFIQTNPSARELKRALAVKLALQSTPYAKITTLLCISLASQSGSKKFETAGLDGIKLLSKVI